MNSARFLLGLMIAAAFGLPIANLNAAHPYHVSLTEIEWNPDTGRIEVAMWVWPADLEKALAKKLGHPVDLDTEKDLDKKLADLLADHFSASQPAPKKENVNAKSKAKRPAATPRSLRWVGHEADLKQAWLYFEIKDVDPKSPLTLSNRLFFDLNEDQLNQLNAKLGATTERMTFTSSAPSQQFKIGERSRDRRPQS